MAGTATSDAELRTFLTSLEGTYGWETAGGELSYDFWPSGKVHIQGKDGEATMWQGDWTLADGTITVTEPSLPTVVFRARKQGDNLILNDVVWTRYRP